MIDNADLLLDDVIRKHIVFDTDNQYFIIGRNPSGLFLLQEEINELDADSRDDITVFRLKKMV